MRIGITAPVYIANNNHKVMFERMTKSIRTSHEFVFIPVKNYVVENFNKPLEIQLSQQPYKVITLEGRQPQAVSKAWNDGIQRAIDEGCEYIFIFNIDIQLKSDAIDNLIRFAESHPEAVIWSMGTHDNPFNLEDAPLDEGFNEHPNFSGFMVRKDFFTHVGKFDENIVPAYYEDNDMVARLSLANKKAYVYGGSRFFHVGSGTIKADYNYETSLPPLYEKNHQYFISKWGHEVVNEPYQMRELYFKTPFNDPSKKLEDW